MARIPVVVAEQNAVPGAANRLAMRVGARAVALSFDGTPLPRQLPSLRPSRRRRRRSRAVVTGNPVRPEVLAVDRGTDRLAARARLSVPDDRYLVLLFGGSLGARRLNDAAVAARRLWHDRSDLALRHVVGDRDWGLLADERGARDGECLHYEAIPYEDAMADCLAAADLAVCRAGASTVAELTAVGLPAVLVPLPGAPGDHQTANARVLQRAGAAVLVPDADLDGEMLVATVDALLADPAQLKTMSVASAELGRRDAARRVADLVEDVALRPRPRGPAADMAEGATTPTSTTAALGSRPDALTSSRNGGHTAAQPAKSSEESRP
jgi:UDP-N-acetylglucosamine--N-acetylmuramyl-(pentapeptide) pyrophosphoryl-undecaprenol N-acetylglucosamine transferase